MPRAEDRGLDPHAGRAPGGHLEAVTPQPPAAAPPGERLVNALRIVGWVGFALCFVAPFVLGPPPFYWLMMILAGLLWTLGCYTTATIIQLLRIIAGK